MQNITTKCSQPGLEPALLDPKTSALTMRPLSLNNTSTSRFFYYKNRNSRPDINSDLTIAYFPIVVGLPTLVVAVSLAATGGHGYADPQSCWLSTRNHILWAFVVPALLIVSVSFACYFMYLCRKATMLPQTKKDMIKRSFWVFFNR